MKTEDKIRIVGISEDRTELYLNGGAIIKSISGAFDPDKIGGFPVFSGTDPPDRKEKAGAFAPRSGYTSYT